MPRGEEYVPFDYHLPGTFDIPPSGPKGPTLGGAWIKGEKKFSPHVNDFNWKARVRSETKAADRFENFFDMATMTFQPPKVEPLRPTTPADWASTTLPKYVEDEAVKKALTVARRRAREIDSGCPTATYPTVKANLHDGANVSKRDLVLGAAKPFLSTATDLEDLDRFMATKIPNWKAEPPRCRRAHQRRPVSQASATRPKLASRGMSQGSLRPGSRGEVPSGGERHPNLVRPGTVAAFSSRQSVKQAWKRVNQTRFTHFEL